MILINKIIVHNHPNLSADRQVGILHAYRLVTIVINNCHFSVDAENI